MNYVTALGQGLGQMWMSVRAEGKGIGSRGPRTLVWPVRAPRHPKHHKDLSCNEACVDVNRLLEGVDFLMSLGFEDTNSPEGDALHTHVWLGVWAWLDRVAWKKGTQGTLWGTQAGPSWQDVHFLQRWPNTSGGRGEGQHSLSVSLKNTPIQLCFYYLLMLFFWMLRQTK